MPAGTSGSGLDRCQNSMTGARPPIELVPAVRRVARPRDVRDDVEVDGDAAWPSRCRAWSDSRETPGCRARGRRANRATSASARARRGDGDPTRAAHAMSPTMMAATSARPMAGCSASVWPAAATISGDGVSPAASAAASGSPPGSAAATARADARPFARLRPQAAHDRQLDLGIERLHDRPSAAGCRTARACGSTPRGSCLRARAGR